MLDPLISQAAPSACCPPSPVFPASEEGMAQSGRRKHVAETAPGASPSSASSLLSSRACWPVHFLNGREWDLKHLTFGN